MIYTKICPKCGTEFKTTRGYQKYCSKTCSNRGRQIIKGNFDESLEWKKTDEFGMWECPYNHGCACEVRECSKCGWNPEVAQARLDEYNRKYQEAQNG